MSCCCTNPINLGCLNVCIPANVGLGELVQPANAGTWTFILKFMGVERRIDIVFLANANFQFDSTLLAPYNEDFTYEMNTITPDGTFYKCYTFKTTYSR